jgi:uncharacterized RDD family membrane protein YckC
MGSTGTPEQGYSTAAPGSPGSPTSAGLPPGNTGYSPPPAGYPRYEPAPPPAPDYGYGQAGIPMPPGMYYDPDSQLAVPNGTTLASHGRRIGAYFLAIPLSIVTLFIGYAIWGLIVWGRGQTPALQVLGMRCWKLDHGRRADWGDMALREIVGRFIIEGIVPFAGLVSFIMFLATKQRRAIHDYVGGTVVLHDPNKVLAEEAP